MCFVVRCCSLVSLLFSLRLLPTPSGDLRFLGDVTSLLGQPLIPCLFLVLGANLAEGPGAAQVISTLSLLLCLCVGTNLQAG
jgi:predicted permease